MTRIQRILLILAVALVVAAMTVVMSGGAFAKLKTTGNGQHKYTPNGEKINHKF